MGRRERKKAVTRASLADAAMRLFLERGFDQVTLKEIADAADVSTTTLFKYFPSKESLVFDLDEEREAELLAVVRDRPAGMSIPEALRHEMRKVASSAEMSEAIAAFHALSTSTQSLRDYGQRMWMRHANALARAIAEDIGAPADDPASLALARFSLDVRLLASDYHDPVAAIDRIFTLLEEGWNTIERSAERSAAQS